MGQATTLRRLLGGPGLLRAPGVYDGVSAHLVREAGFPLAYFTGGAVASYGFGVPDVGLVTASQMAERLEVVVEACGGLPVIADADTGYGTAMHVARTVRRFERAGAAAIQLEDQAFPKRCGHLSDKQVIPADEFVGKLRAALDARTEDTVVVARTDAAATDGIDEAIARGQRYADEGADIVFVEAPTSQEQIERIVAEIDAPVLFNVVPGGRSPRISDAELEKLGYRVVIHPGAIASPVLTAAAAALAELGGKPAAHTGEVLDLFTTVGLKEWQGIDQRYSPAGVAATEAR